MKLKGEEQLSQDMLSSYGVVCFDIEKKSKERFSGMVKQKRQLQKGAAFALLLVLLPSLLLAGCKAEKDLPFYWFTDGFDNDENPTLTVDGVQYIQDSDTICHRTDTLGLIWKFSGEIGNTIGVCDDDAENGGSYKVCQIKGDKEQNFLYILPNHFVFGPYITFFCIREDLQINPPSMETVSSVVLVDKDTENILAQIDDPDMIASLLESFEGDSIQTRNGEGWVYGSLTMQHKDFSFLQCEIKYCYSPEQEISFCQNADREWLPLPTEWFTVFSEHN